MVSFQWRYFDGSVWKSMRLLPLLNLRSASAMDSSQRHSASRARMFRSPAARGDSGRPNFARSGNIAFVVLAQEPVDEVEDRSQRRFARVAVRRVPGIRQQPHIWRAIALLLRRPELPHGSLLGILALH